MDTTQLLIIDRRAVRKVFKKSDENVERDIEIIRKWVKNQPHLPEIPSDNMIEMFLTANKYSIELTKQKLEMYYTIRGILPEVYESSHPLGPGMQGVSDKMGIFIALPKPTEDNYRVFVVKFWENADEFDVDTFYAHLTNIYEMRIQHDITVGDIYLIDDVHIKLGHILKFTPSHLIKLAAIVEKVFSNRFKGMHLINYPPFIDILMTIGKKILKPKLYSRIHLHNSIEEFYQHVPKQILPRDYGGDEPPLQEFSDMWNKFTASNIDRFDKLAKMKVKEELRPVPLKNDEILGYHGNFKKLDVD